MLIKKHIKTSEIIYIQSVDKDGNWLLECDYSGGGIVYKAEQKNFKSLKKSG